MGNKEESDRSDELGLPVMLNSPVDDQGKWKDNEIAYPFDSQRSKHRGDAQARYEPREAEID